MNNPASDLMTPVDAVSFYASRTHISYILNSRSSHLAAQLDFEHLTR